MTILAVTLINEVAFDLSDPEFELWTQAEMLSFLNDAQSQICLLKPDALSESQAFLLAPGLTKQTLPEGYLRLIEGAARNMGEGGATPGRVIRYVDRESMDIMNQNWHSEDGEVVIKNIVYNENNPLEFFTIPAAHATTDVFIELVMSKAPVRILIADIALAEIELADIYSNPIKEFMYYRAYSKETDSADSRSLAKSHELAFYNSLGVKAKAESRSSASKERGKVNG